MPHRTTGFGAVVVAALLAAPAASQSLVPQPTPESHVLEAKRLLGDVAASPTTETGKQIATLQVHFTDFASTYLMGKPQSRSGAEAVGTSGTIGAKDSDWKDKYAAVERDLTALIGSPDPKSPERGVPSLDPTVRKQLQSVRKNLQLFYAAALGQPAREKPDPDDALRPR